MAKDRRKLQHIHSSVVDKQPTPQTLEVGEIAVNNGVSGSTDRSFLSIKNADNKIVRFSTDEQMITWMEKKEVVPYVGQVRGDDYSATTTDMGSVGITNDDLLQNKSNIVIKMNQVAAGNTPKSGEINAATDIYGHYVNLDKDGQVQGAGFSIDMSRYAMIGANPTFSSLTVTDKTDLSGNTTITDGDGTGTRKGKTFTVKVTNEIDNVSARTTTIGTEVLTVTGTTTETHNGNVKIDNKSSKSETTDGTLTEKIKTNNYRDVNGNYSGTTGGTTTEVKTGAVTETNSDTTTITRVKDVTETDNAARTLNVSGVSTTNVGGNVIENTTGTTTIDRKGVVSVNNQNNVTVTTSGTTTETKVDSVTEKNLNDKTETTVGNNYENVSGITVINHSGTTNYNYTGGTTLSGSSLESTTTSNTIFNASGNTAINASGNTTVTTTGDTTIQSTGDGSDVKIYAKDVLTLTGNSIEISATTSATTKAATATTSASTVNITGSTTLNLTGQTVNVDASTSTTEVTSAYTSVSTANTTVASAKTNITNATTTIGTADTTVTSAKTVITTANTTASTASLSGKTLTVDEETSISAKTPTFKISGTTGTVIGSTELNLSGDTINIDAKTATTEVTSAYTTASTATTKIDTADASATTATLSGNTLEVKENTSLTFSGGTLTSTTTGDTTFNVSGKTKIDSISAITIQATNATDGDINIYAKDALTESGKTVDITATTSATTKAATATTSAATTNITGATAVKIYGGTIDETGTTVTISGSTKLVEKAPTVEISGNSVNITGATSARTEAPTTEIVGSTKLNMSGATSTLSGTTTNIYGATNLNATGATVTVSGSTKLIEKAPTIEISGGTLSSKTTGNTTIEATGNGADVMVYAKDKVDITGDTVNISGTTTISGDVTIGGTLTIPITCTGITSSTFDDAICEVLTRDTVTMEVTTPEATSEILKTYKLYQNGAQIGVDINIPKDHLLKSAEIVYGKVNGSDFTACTATSDECHWYIKLIWNVFDPSTGHADDKTTYMPADDFIKDIDDKNPTGVAADTSYNNVAVSVWYDGKQNWVSANTTPTIHAKQNIYADGTITGVTVSGTTVQGASGKFTDLTGGKTTLSGETKINNTLTVTGNTTLAAVTATTISASTSVKSPEISANTITAATDMRAGNVSANTISAVTDMRAGNVSAGTISAATDMRAGNVSANTITAATSASIPTISATTISAGTIHTSGLEGALSWSYGDTSGKEGGSYNGSAAKAITIPSDASHIARRKVSWSYGSVTDATEGSYNPGQTDDGSFVIPSSLSHITSAHTHTLSAITDITATVANLNSITGSVGTMAYQNTSSYSSATEVRTALGTKTNDSTFTAHTASTVHMSDTEKTNLDSLATNIAAISGISSTKVSNWDGAATNSHTHSNKTVLDGISSDDITNWNSKTSNVGTVTSVQIGLPTGLSAATTAITESGKFDIKFSDGYSIPTTSKQGQWDTAYSNNHTHSNKSTLDAITATSTAINSLTGSVGTMAYESKDDYSKIGHTHDDRYYTEDESDGRFVHKTGDTMTGDLTVQGSIYQTSDERLKENIIEANYADMANANMLKIKKFNFINDEEKKPVYGVIAQEAEALQLNDVVVTKEDGMKAVDYTGITLLKIAYLEHEIKRLNKIIEGLIENKQ